MCHWTAQVEFSLKQDWFLSSSSQHQKNHAASLCKWYCCDFSKSITHSLIQASSYEHVQSQELEEDTENSWHLSHMQLQNEDPAPESDSLCEQDTKESSYAT